MTEERINGSDDFPQPEPKRDPRPVENGTYQCYEKHCTNEAEIAKTRSIESTGYDPLVATITLCGQCFLAHRVLKETRVPLDASMEHYDLDDERRAIIPDEVAEEIDAINENGWHDERLYPRLLAFSVLYGDPRGPDDGYSDPFEAASPAGRKTRELFDTPLDEQLAERGISAPKELGQ